MTFDLIMALDPICLSRGNLGTNLFALLCLTWFSVYFLFRAVCSCYCYYCFLYRILRLILPRPHIVDIAWKQ